MKKLITILLISMCYVTNAQEVYSVKDGGAVLDSKGNTIPVEKVKELMKDNQEALKLYTAGRSKKTVGNVLLYGGIVALVYGMYISNRGYTDTVIGYEVIGAYRRPIYESASPIPMFFGLAMMIPAIPVKIGFTKKIEKAISMLNDGTKSPKTSMIESSSIIINQNGVGIAMNF